MRTTEAGVSAERFVEAALELVSENGGSQGLNLREVARRVGCAHTNAYNYFSSLEDLKMSALRRAFQLYAECLVHGLDDSLSRDAYHRQLVTNLTMFPQQHPGLYRFIDTDPIDVDGLPEDIFETVLAFKRWLLEAFTVLCGPDVAAADIEDLCNITTAYVDGETLNLINGRVVPGEDIAGRVVDNAVRLFRWLTADDAVKTPDVGARNPVTYPVLTLPTIATGLANAKAAQAASPAPAGREKGARE